MFPKSFQSYLHVCWPLVRQWQKHYTKTGRKNRENWEIRSDGHVRITQTEALGLVKACVAQSKKMLEREDHF